MRECTAAEINEYQTAIDQDLYNHMQRNRRQESAYFAQSYATDNEGELPLE